MVINDWGYPGQEFDLRESILGTHLDVLVLTPGLTTLTPTCLLLIGCEHLLEFLVTVHYSPT